MKTVGIIVEYNPLHNGHLYHIEETRRLSKCDTLICVMSGNFTQRGEPALIDKFTRTKMALQEKVDMVVELPFVFSVQSADMFSFTSVSILDILGVDEIYFGSESGDIKKLETIADMLEDDTYNSLVKSYMSKGHSYPTSSNLAMKELHPQSDYDLPNNILGIQYIKAVRELGSNIELKTIPRKSTGYYSEIDEDTTIQSATSIRKLIKDNQDISKFVPNSVDVLLKGRKIVDLNDFTEQFKYLLSSKTSEELREIFNITEGIENRLLKVNDFDSVDHLIELVISKRYTNSKLRRILIHVLCNTRKDLLTNFNIPYIRILGMNDQGKAFLNQIKDDVSVPLITKIKKKKHPFLEQELRASKVYNLVSDKDVYKQEFEPVIYLRFN